MLKINVLLLTSAILFALCESAAILGKINPKCEFSDIACKEKLFHVLMDEIADNGIPELGVPRTDPYELKNEAIELLGMIKVTVSDGKVSGLKKCETTVFQHDIENSKAILEVMCDTFTIEGKYKLEPTPALTTLSGGIKISGEGNGGVTLKKLKLNLETPYQIVKGDDGEFHVKILADDATYSFEILDKATFHADNVLIGTQEISTVFTNIVNENWEFTAKTLGKNVMDKAIALFYKNVSIFLDAVPLKEFISDDVSSYVKS